MATRQLQIFNIRNHARAYPFIGKRAALGHGRLKRHLHGNMIVDRALRRGLAGFIIDNAIAAVGAPVDAVGLSGQREGCAGNLQLQCAHRLDPHFGCRICAVALISGEPVGQREQARAPEI